MADLDVILAAHGAGDGSSANTCVQACARQVEKMLEGASVTAAFIRGTPTVGDALRRTTRAGRIVIPMLTSDGHFASVVRHETERQSGAGVSATITAPLGTHPELVDAITRSVEQALERQGSTGVNAEVVVVGHGTTRHPQSRLATQRVVDAIVRATRIRARAAFLDDQPSVEQVIAGPSPASHILIVPFLLGGGRHAGRDLPARVRAAATARGPSLERVTLLDPLAELPILAEIITRVIGEARQRRVELTVGARGSELSRRQVALVAAQLAPMGVDLRLVPIETLGDRDRSTPVDAFGKDDVFTDTISSALVSGSVDLAIHSYKDLPLAGDPAIVDAAILPRGPAHEVLVSRSDIALADLPDGARIGVSCARRASQLRALHPGLVPMPMRGDVPTRVIAVDQGSFEAVILAAAGLERLDLSHRMSGQLSIHQFMPAPAQGAIVVQCRADSPHRQLLARIDDPQTRRATSTERVFARQSSSTAKARPWNIPAAHATCTDQEITLRARLIDGRTLAVRNATVRGTDPTRIGHAAADRLRDLTNGGRVRP